MGALSNIDREGFASVAFHSFPSTLKWDPYSGDYGPNFFGHAFNTATYVIKHAEFGWQSFGGNIEVRGNWVNVQPLDSFRKRVYIAPVGLWLTLDAGTFETIALNTKSNVVRVTLSAADQFTPMLDCACNNQHGLQTPAPTYRRQSLLTSGTHLRFRLDVRRRPSNLSHKKAQETQTIYLNCCVLVCG